MLRITHLTFRYGGRLVFDRTSAHVPAGHRVGLVGRNGAGKTTLLRLITGELEADGGELALRRGARLGVINQEPPGGSASPLEAVLAADRERARLLARADAGDGHDLDDVHERLRAIDAHAAPARAAAILAGLGFDAVAQARPLASFSGGWRMRVGLAAALFLEPDLLLLDEPTNHLDLEASMWLETFLRRYPRTLIIVSHDRHFLNAVVDRVLHVDQGRLTLYEGDYDAFERRRAAEQERLAALHNQQETYRKHLQSFVDRFRYKASKARQAQSRLKAIARLEPLAELTEEHERHFAFPEPAELAPPLMVLDKVSVGYGERTVLARLDLRLDADDRIALIGANGNGKTTFARLLADRLAPRAGEVRRARGLKIGYFAQDLLAELDGQGSPFVHVQGRRPTWRAEQVRAWLGRFGLGGDFAARAVIDLSGGERTRLALALVCLDAPQLLVLDEPTNHLDMAARRGLVDGLNAYGGAVVLVSHDRDLVDLVADRLWLVADGTVAPFDGDIDGYRDLVLKTRQTADEPPRSEPHPPRKPSQAERARIMALRRALRDAEAAVERLGKEQARLDARLADPTTYGRDGVTFADLAQQRSVVAARLAQAEDHWLAAQAAIEAAGPDAG
ncbi:MAG: ABC-F family ATP-binding cassette domain-containing protein [Alphaproteobacteria bacterium]|nr:ABC-F family ATP-binding cassette domain-containing protein [Alphaproteobacteria bacterium]